MKFLCSNLRMVSGHRILYLFVLLCQSAFAQDNILLNPVLQGLSSPIQFVNAGDGTKRIFIAEKGGAVKVFDSSYRARGTFFIVDGIATDGEHGLLSIVFHPRFKNNGYVYSYYTASSGNLEIARYHISNDPDRIDPLSRVLILTIPHPGQTNHNGGELHFGKDGFLYVSTGDGGGSGDINNNAQNTTKLLGKILRIDVDNPGADSYYSIPAGNPFNNEIFALGLRNPFRWSFDRENGDIWIGDVGQDSWEEIDYIESPAGGENFGWRCYEGNVAFNNSQCNNDYLHALYTYPTADPAASVIGGVVYRGNRFPALKGFYIAADYFSGNFYKIDGKGETTVQENLARNIADFGENEDGEVFAVSLSNGIVSMVMDASAAPLPVTLTSFSAEPVNGGVNLHWTTSSEQNTSSFEIEYSTDGASFALAATFQAANGTSEKEYSYTHKLIQTGILYYRLRITDVDGTFTYSNIVVVPLGENRREDFVNPSVIRRGSLLTAYLPGNFSTLEIVNTAGVIVHVENLRGRSGRSGINISNLLPGLYFVRLNGKEKILLQRIVITD